jgi:hypothetical protein
LGSEPRAQRGWVTDPSLVKLLLDAMMPEDIGPLLFGHEVSHVAEFGWRHLSNGKLLNVAESHGFEVLITKDSNMPYQQNLSDRKISLVIVKPKSQDLVDLHALSPRILAALVGLMPGTVSRVTGEDH